MTDEVEELLEIVEDEEVVDGEVVVKIEDSEVDVVVGEGELVDDDELDGATVIDEDVVGVVVVVLVLVARTIPAAAMIMITTTTIATTTLETPLLSTNFI